MGKRRKSISLLPHERQVLAEQLASGRFRLLGAQPDDEQWEFEPGSVVECEARTFSGRLVLVATARVSP